MLIDSHCHIPHKKYEMPLEKVLEEAKNNDVSHMISIGTSIKNSRETIEAVNHLDNVYCTAGIYPHDDMETPVEDLYDQLKSVAHTYKNKVVGIGECGIDLTDWKGGRSLEEQYDLFQATNRASYRAGSSNRNS